MESKLLGIQKGDVSAALRGPAGGEREAPCRAECAWGRFRRVISPKRAAKSPLTASPESLPLATKHQALATVFEIFMDPANQPELTSQKSGGGHARGHSARKGRGKKNYNDQSHYV